MLPAATHASTHAGIRSRGWCGPLLRLLAACVLGGLCCASAQADQSTDQIALAAGGRFDLLEQQLEAQLAKGPLDTRDRHALCWAYSKTKRYTRLMACLDQLALSLQKGSRRTRLFQLDDATPSMGLMRAEALLELGQYANAIKEASRNLAWLKQDGSDDLDMLVNTEAILSMAYTLSGERDRGAQMAQTIAQANIGVLSPYAGARALALARARMALGDYHGVIEALNADKTFAINVFLDRLFSGGFLTGVNNWVWVELPRAFMMNKALLETGHADEAKAGFDRLLAIKQVRENGEIYWLLLNDRGLIAEQEQDRQAALGFYRQAIDVVEEQRASINTEAGKIGFVGDKQALYARTIALALELKQSALAFDYMERAKSRALVDLLAAQSVQAATPGKSLLALEHYRQAAENASAQLPLNMGSGSENRSAMSGVVQHLKQHEPELASLVTVNSLSLAAVRSHLAADEVLIEYFLYGKNGVMLAISGDNLQVASIDSTQLERDVRAFRSLIEARKPAALAASQALYASLIKPVDKLIKGKNLVIVPHGTLHYLPFAALHDGSQYLIAAHGLRYLPSASVQKYLRAPTSAPPDNMLAFGNPDLGKPEYDLPSAGEEAKAVAHMLPHNKLLTRREASETAFKLLAGNYRFLHMATHGEFNGDAPLQSRLVLAPDGQNDGSLNVSEIYDLHLQADLVTLSACETGLSKTMNGDDVIGMTRGFLYAGASNVIASLWAVDDEATAALMTQFYKHIQAGLSKKEALRKAQQSLQSRYAEPFFWAAFYLTGQGK